MVSKEKTSIKKVKGTHEDISELFGENILISGKRVVDRKNIIIPVSPAIDSGLGGGIPEGSFCIFTGQPKIGKTTVSLDFAATFQKPEFQGTLKKPREVYYLNVEGRLKKRDLEGIPGLDLERFFIIESQEGKILSAEDYLQIGEKIINEVPGCLIIVDSFSALCTQTEITSDMDKMQRADGAKLLKKFCRKIANVLPVNRTVLIGITHLIGNPSGYGSPYQESGGQGIAYQVDVKIKGKSVTKWKLTEDGDQIGQIVDWEVMTSALGPPGPVINSYIRYGYGIDKASELASLASDIGIITKSGSWFSVMIDGKEHKVQGIEKVRQLLIDNPELYEKLYKNVREMLGLK